MKVGRTILLVAASLAALWALLAGILVGSMFFSPSTHATVMSYYWNLPRPVFIVLPMIGGWNFARGGALQVGDLAPDFTLQSADRRASVHLSSFRGKQPVLLVFGSYT
jgi:hypothetical protein